MALNCLSNVRGDIYIIIPTVVMFEILPATIPMFYVFQCLCIFGRNFYSVIHTVFLFYIKLQFKLMFNISCTHTIVIINK